MREKHYLLFHSTFCLLLSLLYSLTNKALSTPVKSYTFNKKNGFFKKKSQLMNLLIKSIEGICPQFSKVCPVWKDEFSNQSPILFNFAYSFGHSPYFLLLVKEMGKGAGGPNSRRCKFIVGAKAIVITRFVFTQANERLPVSSQYIHNKRPLHPQ